MPGPVVHTIISEHLPGAFGNANFQGSQQIANALTKNKDSRRAMTYGAMGPDPFFFNLDDYAFLPDGTAKAIIKAWNVIGRFQNQLHELTKPLKDARRKVKNGMQKGNKTLQKASPTYKKVVATLKRFREVSKTLGSVVRGFVKKFILNNSDPFAIYVSSYQRCESDHEKWWWFDTLHTRQTGDFVSRLLDVARGRRPGAQGKTKTRSLLLSYAVGYLSHIAADVVGHAYVNTIVGGPYRLNHAQRHTTQEKFMDVWAYKHYWNNGFLPKLNRQHKHRYYMNPQAINSGLHKNQQFARGNIQPHSYQINNNRLFQRTKPNRPINGALRLPAEISENFAHTATQLYNTGQNAGEYGPLTKQEVDVSYRLWYMVLRNSTNTRNVVKPKNLPGAHPINKAIQKQWQKLKQWIKNNLGTDVGGVGGGGGGSCGTGKNWGQRALNCLKNAAKSVWNFLTNLAKAIANLVKILSSLIYFMTQKLLTLPLDFVNFLLGRIYESIYDAYRKLLLMMTCLGMGYCHNDQLKQGQIRHLTDPTAKDHFDNTVRDTIVKPNAPESGFPRLSPKMGKNWNNRAQGVMNGLKNEAHLVIPDKQIGGDFEYPKTVPGPDVYASNTPEVFISDPNDRLNFSKGYVPKPPKRSVDDSNANNQEPSPRRDETSMRDFLPYDEEDSRPKGSAYTQPVLGDAVQLTVELLKMYMDPNNRGYGVPNLNMSGDRGIGHPTWANMRDPPCEDIRRYRWQVYHGKYIPWLNGGTRMTENDPEKNPLNPVFEPDPTRTPPGY